MNKNATKQKIYIVPAFIVVENAKTLDEAIAQAALHQEHVNGSILLLDEELPTVDMTPAPEMTEYPHSLRAVPKMKHFLK